MSSYRGAGGAGGAWDGGPPGAESEYGQPHYTAPPPPRALPHTDPWTGVSYSQYGQPPNFGYQAYGTGYGYGYDSNYYQGPESTYYPKYSDSRAAYPSAQQGYDYSQPPCDKTQSSVDSQNYKRRKDYRSKSRSGSPYERRGRSYSRNRESSYERGKRHKSRSRSPKLRNSKYSSTDHSSSRSKSYSHSPSRKEKKKRSISSDSSASGRSYNNKNRRSRGHDSSCTPPLKNKSKSRSHSRTRGIPSKDKSSSKSPRLQNEKELSKHSTKYHSNKDIKIKDRKHRDISTPPRKRKEDLTPPRCRIKTERLSLTPPKSYKSDRQVSPKKYKDKQRNTDTQARKGKQSSVTPPKCYTRSSSSSSSRSSLSERAKRKHSRSPYSSSRSSISSRRSRSKSKRRHRRSVSKNRSHSKSRSKHHSSSSKRRSASKSRSKSRRRSKSRGKSKAKARNSKSRSPSSRSHSHSDSESDDERRGQFTVADRKRFWKLHRSRQEREKEKSPVKEVKPPPGAIESTRVDDIEYGDPPEVEGPNFAELLPTPDQVIHSASTSKSRPVPIPIKNDGSFLEMFKKMQGDTKKLDEEEKKPQIKKPALPFIGKRRGGRVLKTGMVKKAKAIDEQTVDSAPKDAWSLYMQEVKKYRETSCEEERKTRPLVK